MFVSRVITFFLIFELVNSEGCRTPNGQDGNCMPINHCPSIFALFRHPPLSTTTATFIRKSQCGLQGVYPKVCCPDVDKKKLLPEVCGVNGIQNKIFGGERAGLDEFPWMALLEYRIGGNSTFGCGGALITKRYVLTAKHCLKEYLVRVFLGEYDTRTDPDCVVNSQGSDCNSNVLKIGIEERISHKGSDDVALLRLNQDVEFNDFVKPICLPFSTDGLDELGKKLTVSGWGITEKEKPSEVKLKVQVPVKPLMECTKALKTVFNIDVELNDGHLCAGGEQGKDSCNGDSGGPLMAAKLDKDKNLEWYVIGVVSFGPTNPCGRKDKPAVYVKVSKYVDWILENLKP